MVQMVKCIGHSNGDKPDPIPPLCVCTSSKSAPIPPLCVHLLQDAEFHVSQDYISAVRIHLTGQMCVITGTHTIQEDLRLHKATPFLLNLVLSH